MADKHAMLAMAAMDVEVSNRRLTWRRWTLSKWMVSGFTRSGSGGPPMWQIGAWRSRIGHGNASMVAGKV
jgi:hypothetical protein